MLHTCNPSHQEAEAGDPITKIKQQNLQLKAQCATDLRQKEILQLLLLMRQCDHPSISVHDTHLLNTDVQLQLDGPADTHSSLYNPKDIYVMLTAWTKMTAVLTT